jgi:hypothetical protein
MKIMDSSDSSDHALSFSCGSGKGAGLLAPEDACNAFVQNE